MLLRDCNDRSRSNKFLFLTLLLSGIGVGLADGDFFGGVGTPISEIVQFQLVESESRMRQSET